MLAGLVRDIDLEKNLLTHTPSFNRFLQMPGHGHPINSMQHCKPSNYGFDLITLQGAEKVPLTATGGLHLFHFAQSFLNPIFSERSAAACRGGQHSVNRNGLGNRDQSDVDGVASRQARSALDALADPLQAVPKITLARNLFHRRAICADFLSSCGKALSQVCIVLDAPGFDKPY